MSGHDLYMDAHILYPPKKESMRTCPVRNQPCARTPECTPKLEEYQGITFCEEWLLQQREEGRKNLEANTSRPTTETRSKPAS